ncbi:hypothetical protein LSPCS325_08880 [Lysinibacillus sp. CTST325]
MKKSIMPFVGRPKEGQSLNEHFAEIYKMIGKHFENQADIMAGDVNELTTQVTLTIYLNPNEYVTIDKTTNQIVIGE